MVGPIRTSCIIGSFLLLMVLSVVFFTLPPQTAQAAKNACPLTVRQETKAAKAFKKLAPVFQESRCLNCHGAVNPFSRIGGHGGGYIDIRKETGEFLKTPGFQSSLTVGADPDGTRTARDIAGLKEIAESPSEISDTDLIRQKAFDPMRKACKECHVSAWIIPMRHNHFVGRSAKEMCMHIKTSSLTNQPDLFLRHMQDDELVLEGFKGRKGLLESGAPEPPTISFATVEKYANDWVEAMGGKFHDPPDCGCVIHGDYILEFQSRIVSSEITKPVESVAAAEIVLTPVEGKEGWYRGSGMLGYQTGPLPNRHPCSMLVMGHGTTVFEVADSSIKISEGTGAGGSQTGSADIELRYRIHSTNETVQNMAMVNFQCVPGKKFPYSFFSSSFARARRADADEDKRLTRLKGWTYVGKDGVVATKRLQSNCVDFCDQEESVFTLKEADGSEGTQPPK